MAAPARPTTTNADAAARALTAIVGETLPIVRLRKAIVRFSSINAPLLITGESGSGKELVARAIHACSTRVRERFVPINVGTLSPNTIASELFGHARGAFTGAVAIHKGLFEQADRGTIFLDEIAELTPEAQAHLLRVLEHGEVRPLGGEHMRTVDVRVVCATHRDLGEMVRAGKFRTDLHHRLRVLTITTPPLRERADDVPLIARHLLARHERDLGPREIAPEGVEALAGYPWPGNVRQLGSVLVRAAARTDGRLIDRAAIEYALGEETRANPTIEYRLPMRRPTDAPTLDAIREALRESRGRVATAARMLGVPRSTLRDRVKLLGIAGNAE